MKETTNTMETKEKTLTTTQVADRFYELAQQGKFDEIQDELYDSRVKSVEPAHSDWQTVEGLDKVKEKAVQWQETIEEMHGGYTNAPQVAGNFFSCVMGMDVTLKGQPRMKLDEIAVYEVRDGKIVLEQFFF